MREREREKEGEEEGEEGRERMTEAVGSGGQAAVRAAVGTRGAWRSAGGQGWSCPAQDSSCAETPLVSAGGWGRQGGAAVAQDRSEPCLR